MRDDSAPTAGDPTIDSVRAAARRIAPIVSTTPVRPSPALSALTGAPVLLKCETAQPTGSFKVRGATNAVVKSVTEQGAAGVVAASTGNHGRAVAFAARSLGIKAIVCLAHSVVPERVAAIRAEGADVRAEWPDQRAAIRAATEIADENGFVFIPPFDHPDVISGQGTIATEIAMRVPAVSTVLVPVSGGGLASGVALALASVAPEASVIGVYAGRSPVMAESLTAGAPVTATERETIAHSLMGDLGPDNQYTFRLVRRHVADLIAVSEEQIRSALAWLARHERLIVEGAAATVVAALLANPRRFGAGTTVAVLTGDAVPESTLAAIAAALETTA